MRKRLAAVHIAGVAGWALLAAGCETASPARAVPATYRFDAVRSGGGADEWSAIRDILQKHSTTKIVEERRRRATMGVNEISDYRATLTLPNMAAGDEINAEIAALASGPASMEFGLVDAQVSYRGNTVAAGVTLFVSGFATQGNRVRLFPGADADPIELTAGRNGLWSAKLASAPDDGWLYGLSEDPSGRVRSRYFRVNVSNQKQEVVSEADFWKRFPQWKPAAEQEKK